MSSPANVLENPQSASDYSLIGLDSARAIERGLAEADWYQCPVPRETMRSLLARRNGPAIRDTILWFALILGCALATVALRHSGWMAIPYLAYCVLYASTSDSRWHESGHGTAFASDWMNSALYEMASFMVMRESVVWRWSHTRHHSDTLIVGRDPEIAVPRPADLGAIFLSFFNLKVYPKYFRQMVLHAFGRMSAEEKTYIPETEFPKVFLRGRIYLLVYLAVAALSVVTHSLLPLLFIGLPNLFGSWLMVTYGMTQHAGLAENVLDHRLNCRTVYMNPLHRFLYWNMNYHIEHHMFPLVPYHALPRMHAVVKDDCPPAYPSLLAAWREIVPAVLRQVNDPGYHVKRRLPERMAAVPAAGTTLRERPQDANGPGYTNGWLDVCPSASLLPADVLRVDHNRKTYAVCRSHDGRVYALDGICSHGNTHLAEGLLVGDTIECPKHNGRFHLKDGSPARSPVCRGLQVFPIDERNGRVLVNVAQASGAEARPAPVSRFRVVSNRSVSTFIKELTLEPLNSIRFTPGDYFQFDIPAYDTIYFRDFDIPEPFATVWRSHHLFDLKVSNNKPGRRNNYSLASNAATETLLRLNVRLATPPPGQDCLPGIGSSYIFSLKPGDIISGIGPFGDFHIKPTQREMVYIGGGAGMAPLRAHLSHLLESERTARKVSFWYGARSKQEIFYADYFAQLASVHRNFAFHLALSSPLPEDGWTGHTGFIHEVVQQHHLAQHPAPKSAEYYLCGPPLMIRACTRMLDDLGVPPHQIAYDEF